MVIQTHIIIVRLICPLKSMFGNKIAANSKPDIKPKKFAKLSIIGNKPIAKNMTKVIKILAKAHQGLAKNSQA